MSWRFFGLLTSVVVLLIVSPLSAEDSPRFRGVNGSGTSTETGFPVKWDAKENILWKTDLEGYGASSPVTFRDRIYLTGYSGYGTKETEAAKQSTLELHVLCLNREDGNPLWRQTHAGNPNEFEYRGYVALHGYASGSPAVDETGVYAFFGSSGVVAYNLDGDFLWKQSVGTKIHKFGSGSSPILYENLVIINASVESESLVALDKQTGKEVWRIPDIIRTWNTPALVEVEGNRVELVINARGTVRGFNPETGESLWMYDSGNVDYICPSIVSRDGIVYAIVGRRGPIAAVRAGGRGDVTETHEVWKGRGASNVPSPVLHGDHLYFVSDTGIVQCLDLKTGEAVYKQRLRNTDRVYASLMAADGKLYSVSREKGTFVLAAGPKFEQLSLNVIADDESIFNASPVPCDGRLLLRSDKFLYCIGK